MKIGLDIDNTISAHPKFFADLSQSIYLDGGSCIIISSRNDTEEVRALTTEQLKGWSIRYDKLYLFKPYEDVEHICPHVNLNWYKKYLWQKIDHCLSEGVDRYYEDEETVIELFKSYAPDINIIDVKTIQIPA